MVNTQTDSYKGDILIVDDDLSSLNTLSSMLTEEGYEVRGVPDGPMALTVVENKPPELILLDVRMPGMDGFEVCRQIKADEKSSTIPILFLSALDELQDKVKGFTVGAVDFIAKPFQIEEVLARVDTHLALSRLREHLDQQVKIRTTSLAESEERYHSIVESSPASIITIQNGRISFVNPAGVRMLGFTNPEELVGKPVMDFIAPESKQMVTDRIARLENGRDNLTAEISLIRQDGMVITADSVSAFVNVGGKPTAVVIATDITERKKLEINLKDSEERFRAFMENTPAAIYIKDENDVHLYCNRFAAGVAGMKPEEFIGSRTHDLFPPKIADRLVELDHKVLNENIIRLAEEHLIKDQGTGRWFKDTKFPINLGSGKKLLGGISFDITENKQVEQTLSEQLEFERLIAGIATNLAQIGSDRFKESIDITLQALGRFLKSERAFLAQFTPDGKSLYHTNYWVDEGIEIQPYLFELDLAAEAPWLVRQLYSGKVVNAGPGLVNLPEDAEEVRKRLERDGINSGVVVPVTTEGKCLGMLGLDTVDQPRDYPPVIVDRMKIVANIVGTVIVRIRAQEGLQSSLKEIEQLKDRLEQENIYLREEVEVNHSHGEIVGKSKPVMKMLSSAEQVAGTDSTVLILGETGTGKEVLARSIHKLSSRRNRQMVKVNCAALPATLIESELFGRDKGAYTGALNKQIGRFEIADGSTIFLDEIGELPLELQAKLLNVLQEGTFERLGNPQTFSVDVRIVASTNRNLAKAVSDGTFRQDLYYRLNVFSITVPSLRDRIEDIPLLVWAFVKEFEKSMGKTIEKIPQKSMDALQQYPWPGNIRELRNVVENAMIISNSKTLKLIPPVDPTLNAARNLKLEAVERNHIIDVLKKTSWRVSGEKGAAKLLGLKRTTLDSKMKKLGIVRPN